MAATQSVKCLNTSSGSRRFVFKTFSQRVSEIEIDVFRCLNPGKAEPSEGSSFFRDCLLEWRELNTAEDFISFYDEFMPIVQTLPQILLHKEKIFSGLLSRVNMKARLSLEPILRLIAALSRDILEDFLPFLSRLVGSLLELFKNGGERNSDVLEQVFTSWSCILMYLQKYLMRDIVNILQITADLRYYSNTYIQEFMAEAVSFLVRNAPKNEVIEGVRRVVLEATEEYSGTRTGASALLWHIMRGTTSKLHSKAEQVLRLLMDESLLSMNDAVVDLVNETLERLYEALEPKELTLALSCLVEEIRLSNENGNLAHLSRLLSVLIYAVRFKKGANVFDYMPVLELVKLLVKKYVTTSVDRCSECPVDLVNQLFELMLSLLEVQSIFNNLSPTSQIVKEWGAVFQTGNPRLLSFIREVLTKDPSILNAFRTPIICALDDVIKTSSDDVLYLSIMFFERVENLDSLNSISIPPENKFDNIRGFLGESLRHWSAMILTFSSEERKNQLPGVKISDLATLLGILKSYPHFFCSNENLLEIKNFRESIIHLLLVDADETACISRTLWQNIGATTLLSYQRLFSHCKSGREDISKILRIGLMNKSSSQLLFAVAEYLTSQFRLMDKDEFREVTIDHAALVVKLLGQNLSYPDKLLRKSTLRILSYFTSSNDQPSNENPPPKKKLKTESSESTLSKSPNENIISLLLSIEETPLSVSTSRMITVIISKIQTNVTAGSVQDDYLPLLMNGLVGLFHNRFGYLWDSVIECVSVLISKSKDLVWGPFVEYLQKVQSQFLLGGEGDLTAVDPPKPDGLINCFNLSLASQLDSTPLGTILCLLIRTLQKVSDVTEAKSRHIVPLFLKFLNLELDDTSSEATISLRSYMDKEKKSILKEWLNLFRMMHNSRSLYQNQTLKNVLIERLLDDTDSDTQMKVLDCVLNWKDDYLLPYAQHLKNLVNSKNLREELTTWSLAIESPQIEESHREFLLPFVIRLLAPKVRKLKTLASRKHTSVNHRRAILYFLTQLEVDELPLFFSLIMKPLFSSDQHFDQFISLPLNFLRSEFLSTIIAGLSLKKKFSFLHVVEDILRCFDESHVKPFLDLLLAVSIKILEWCMITISAPSECVDLKEDSTSGLKRKKIKEEKDNKRLNAEAKDLRSLCLKLFCFTLNKYGGHHISSEIWDIFFSSVKPLIDNFIQDISGSENPGSLLLCFVAMSKNSNCVSLLEDLLPKIFSVLTLKKVSESVISSVLKFIENLLVLDGELGHEDGRVKRILLPHLKGLFAGLCQFFQSRKVSQRKGASWLARDEIRIFRLLGRYVTEKSIATEFIDIVLPFFGKKYLTTDECMEGLHVIQGILPLMDGEISKKILNVISNVLSSAGLEVRHLICTILHGLSTVDHSLTFLAKLLHDLNAISSTELDEIDYDTRIGAYETVTAELFSLLDYDRTSIILSQCFNDIASDLILRQSASRALLSFIDFAASFLTLDNDASDKKEAENEDGYIWTRKRIQKIVLRFFLLKISETMNKEISSQKFLSTEIDMSIHKEWIIILREMIWKLPGVPALLSLRPLCNEDLETDFFHNIFHLQTYRRVKALSCFRNAVREQNLSEEMMEKLFVPLFLTMMFEIKGGKGEHLKNAFIDSLASISGKMQWKSYSSLLMRILSFMHKTHSKSDKQKILIRLLISILDNFHFCNGDISNEKDPDLIYHSLQNKILPQIQKFLDSDSESINAQMSLAALKILKLLHNDVLESQLQSIIRRICNFLKNRLESVRDEARSALSACLNVLGISYLSFVVKVLQSTLKRGYEMKVLGYTVNFILSKLSIEFTIGSLDSCMEEILFIAENDILGTASEEEAAKIASRMKESRKKKSFETIKLVSQNITFKSHALRLLSPIKKHLRNHLPLKTKSKIEMILNSIASGIEANPSVDEKELLIFIYGLLEDSDNNDNGLQHSYLISLFALGLLYTRLKNMKLNKKNEELLSMLDPFIQLLARFLSSKYEDVLSAAFKCLIPLSGLPLPSLEAHADKIKILLLDITQRSSNISSQLTQSCLKLLTALLQTTTVSLSDDQLHLLVQFPIFIDIQSKPSHLALSLLKAVVSRKLIVPEIYDLVVKISELMVTSQEDSVRKKCSHILLQFLIDYRISTKRLQQHLDFLLANLSYEHSSGREAVLEMLHAIVVKLPPVIVESQAQSWFLHLVVALANEADKNVQVMISAVIKLLLDRISQKMLHPILEYSLSWYKGEKKHLWSAAAQVLGLVVDILKKGFIKHNDVILPVAKFIMNSALDEVTYKIGADSLDLVPLWKEAYHTLLMLEKMLCQCPELFADQNFEEILEAICKLLLHPHAHVRNTSNRLLALYFSEEVSTKRSIHQEKTFLNPGRLFLLAVSFCIQLKSKSLESDSSATNLIVHNLLFTISGIHSHAKVVGPMPIHLFWDSLCPQQQRFYVDGFGLLGSRKGRNLFIFYTSKNESHDSKNPNLQSLLLFPLLSKMGKIALTGDDNQAKIVFDCFRRISLQFGHEDCAFYAIQLLSPLYRITEGFSGRQISDEVKDLASDVLGKMRGVVGAENFLKAYNEIRKTVKAKRDKRRQAEKLLAVINPMRHAQRKLRISAKHKSHKKKKVAAMKMKRWKR